jgi:hypothetical protein
MCYIYNDDEERSRLMSGFVVSAFSEGERVIYGGHRSGGASLETMLRGLDMTPPEVRPGQFEILQALKTYCPDGRFVPERMLDNVRSLYTTSIEDGFTGARGTAEMEWALEKLPGSERLIEYEALLNTLTARHPITWSAIHARRWQRLLMLVSIRPIVRRRVVASILHSADRYLKNRPAGETDKSRDRRALAPNSRYRPNVVPYKAVLGRLLVARRPW